MVNTVPGTFFDATADETVTAMKASAGYVYWLEVSNIDAVDYFIQFFDLAVGDVTLGTTTPAISFLIPAGDGSTRGAFDRVFNPKMQFRTAITYAITTTVTGSTGPTTALVLNAGMN